MDAQTLLLVNVVNQLAMATILPLIMGRRLSVAAKQARHSLVLQGAGWLALALSGLGMPFWLDGALSTCAMACIAGSHWLLYRALEEWLGPRPGRRWLAAALVMMPLGYALSFSIYPVRVGWSNLLIAVASCCLARACLWPSTPLRGRWRWVLCGGLLVMATLTLVRGVLGAFYTESYPYFTAPNPFNLAAMLAANVTLVVANMAILVAWHQEADQQLRELAATDPLTGLLNRRGWDEQVRGTVSLAIRHVHPIALLMIDLDHFKRINDELGHEAGDEALAMFGRLVQGTKRSGDLAARLGGEEFAVLLPYCDAQAAVAFDHRLRAQLALSPLRDGRHLNFSGGLAVQAMGDMSLQTLMSYADAALYRAKQQGRGRVELAAAASPA